jgi:hypothetical protein
MSFSNLNPLTSLTPPFLLNCVYQARNMKCVLGVLILSLFLWSFTTKNIISIFPLWTFHLYIATFQQHMHMEYIFLSWSDISNIVVHIIISLIEGYCQQGSYWTKGFKWFNWKVLRSPPWFGYRVSVSQMTTAMFPLS